MQYKTLDTQLVHAGEPRPKIKGAVSMPIFCSANFESENEDDYHDLKYIRLNNTPNHVALHEKICAIEGAEAALVFGSGMAAISTTLLTILKPGSHLLAQDCLYGGTRSLLAEDLAEFGVEVSFVNLHRPETWAAQVKAETKGFYVESITNPLAQVGAIDEVPSFCRAHNLLSMIDNTFCTPFNFKPIDHGFDLVLHSATKYLNGHSDIVAGAVAGRRDLVNKIKHRLDHLGGSLDPHACFLLQRGMKTLALRMERQNSNAQTLAEFLASQKSVSKVNYPGLSDHPDNARATKLFRGCGGVLSFEMAGGKEAAQKVLDALTLPVSAPSLGGVETLVTFPAKSSHAGIPDEERRAMGIADGLIRVAIGIEDPQELIDDFAQAISKVREMVAT